jgi:hypothetical protein
MSEWSFPRSSWWHPTGGVPGWACGHDTLSQPSQPPREEGARRSGLRSLSADIPVILALQPSPSNPGDAKRFVCDAKS